ncbi:unnamed protein product [Fusarium graminearum]|nr:unnamed protein product [Fusarium graminearum]
MTRKQKDKNGKPNSDAKKKPRYILDKVRAAEQDIPNFEIGRHLNDTPITLSVLQLLQIQQISVKVIIFLDYIASVATSVLSNNPRHHLLCTGWVDDVGRSEDS